MYHIFTICSSVEGHIGCFHFLTFVTRLAVITDGQISVEWELDSLGHMPRSAVADLDERSAFSF